MFSNFFDSEFLPGNFSVAWNFILHLLYLAFSNKAYLAGSVVRHCEKFWWAFVRSHSFFYFLATNTLEKKVFAHVTSHYTANISTVLSTAFGSVTCATVLWLYILQSKIAIDLKLYSSVLLNVMCVVVACKNQCQITVAHVT